MSGYDVHNPIYIAIFISISNHQCVLKTLFIIFLIVKFLYVIVLMVKYFRDYFAHSARQKSSCSQPLQAIADTLDDSDFIKSKNVAPHIKLL